MSAEIASLSLPPEFPPEIWLKIFRIATFIPRETDVSATTVEPGLFCSHDELQLRAFKAILPLRRTIVLVSRRFYQIGAEVLYTTFHTAFHTGGTWKPDQRLSLFADLLQSRPELGRFVKRLSLQWSVEDEEENYRIISRCPNVTIFTSFLRQQGKDVGYVPWWGRGLPNTIRSFDARLPRVPIKDVLALLEKLPHLEFLHLWGLQGDSISHSPVSLSALRILSIYPSHGRYGIKSCLPVLATMQLPRLTALASSFGVVDGRLTFPLDVWRRLHYFKPGFRSHNGLRSDYFHTLRHLCLIIGSDGIEPSLMCFPFHQLECLTLQNIATYSVVGDQWQQKVELIMVLPLDTKAMPKLKLFQFKWSSNGIYEYYRHLLYQSEGGEQFIRYFETLVTRFEERGVLFVEETNEREICPGFQPIRDVLSACKKV